LDKVDAPGWRSAFEHAAREGTRLGALWGSDNAGRFEVQALLIAHEGLRWLRYELPGEEYPDVSDLFPAALRMQRAITDLLGLRTSHPDRRGWLRHAAWAADEFPLRRNFQKASQAQSADYPFVRVEGDGVHEIPVGPVHAGIIEPGHFRFSIVGERVLKLEQRLGYTHKGIEKRFEGLSLADGARLAGRVSGDSTVAYAWAYAMAVESALGVTPSRRALWLRALLLERERIANHLGDLGYLGNDGGLAFGLAQFMRLKEDLLRLNQRLFGHRYAMDRIVPGGVAVDLADGGLLLEEADRLEKEILAMQAVYSDHAGLQDRFMACGILAPATASTLGVVGLAARASGLAFDARVHPGFAPYDELAPQIAAQRGGDVAARVALRFDEALESLRLQRRIALELPAGELATALPAPREAAGAGWIEGWRGEVMLALECGADGRIRRCHPHDPSWQNWPALEHAVIGNIVPDFPLINKSFNLSYAGVDL
jgi:Ni,Fe-hydrogenase III large subunit